MNEKKIDNKKIIQYISFPKSVNSLEFGIFVVCMALSIIGILIFAIGQKFTIALLIKIIIFLTISTLIANTIGTILVIPIYKMDETLRDFIDDSKDDDDIDVKSYEEFDNIIESVNSILDTARAMDESRSEFVSNVSHELKTPITSMKVLADSLIAQEGDVPVEVYQEFMRDIAKEVEREGDIITDLLTLVKLDQTAAELEIKKRNINELIDLLMKRLVPIAAEQDIDIVCETYKKVFADIDQTKLTLAFSNLLENAIKYNVRGGWVHIYLNSDDKYFYIKIKDSGVGIPEENIGHIFERFYRADKSHSQQISGTGLGLAITRSTIVMHRGAIKVKSRVNEGTMFMVRIPLVYSA